MRIGLLDFNWTGHHTPYADYISRSLLELNHSVTFFTDEAHPNTDSFPQHTDFSLVTLDISEYKSSQENEFKSQASDGFIDSLGQQWTRASQLRMVFDKTRNMEFDLLHMLYFEGSQIPTRLATKMTSYPLPQIVVTLHRDAFTGAARSIPSRLTRFATRKAVSSCLADNTVGCITVHSDGSRRRVRDTVDNATEDNVRTFPAPTPEVSIDLTRDEARKKLDLLCDTPIVLFFGELRHEKGPDILYNAIGEVDEPVTVVYAGPDHDYSKSDVATWSNAVPDHVQVINRVEYVPEDEVDTYFVACDALVVPYRRQRGISGPLRRACMANRHIIGPTDSDIGDIIEQHGLGQTFERESPAALRETLESFIKNQNRYPLDSVQQYGEQLHWRESGRALEKIYQSVLNSSV